MSVLLTLHTYLYGERGPIVAEQSIPEGTILALFRELSTSVYSYPACNVAHGRHHIGRMLAKRRDWWQEIIERDPLLNVDPSVLDLCVMFHDLNRSVPYRGRDESAATRREIFARMSMDRYAIPPEIQDMVIRSIDASHVDQPEQPKIVTLLQDLDKSEGAGMVGLFRMAAVAQDRGYDLFTTRADFHPNEAVQGDENLDSFVTDVWFCFDWWNHQKFHIKTAVIREKVAQDFEFLISALDSLETQLDNFGAFDSPLFR